MGKRLLTLMLAAAALATAATAGWSANGIVVDIKGKPIPKANVYALMSEKPNSKVTLIHADAKGRFTFNPPEPGRWYYLAESKGYGYAMAYLNSADSKQVKIKLWPEKKVAGIVVDQDGKPLPGATVSYRGFNCWDDSEDEARGGKPWFWFRDDPSFTGRFTTDLLYAAFDESRGTGTGYDTLYVDSNRNGDLTDDTPVTLRSTSSYGWTPLVEVQAHQGAEPNRTDNPIKVRWQMGENGPMAMARMGGWRGTVDSSEGPLQCAFVDYEGDGVYNGCFSCSPDGVLREGEIIWGDRISINSDPNRPSMQSPSWQLLSQGGVNILGQKAYLISANPAGNEITIKPYTGEMGKLMIQGSDIAGLNGKVTSVNLIGRQGAYNPSQLDGKPIILPVGEFLISYVSLELSKGGKTMNATGSMDHLINIKPGEQTLFDIKGKPRLVIMGDAKEVALRPGTNEQISWTYGIGDLLQGVYLSAGISSTPVATVRFDSSKTAIPVKPQPGGG